MTQALVNTSATSLELNRQTAVRNASVVFQLNANLCYTESVLNSGTFDQDDAAGIPEPDNAVGVATGAAGVLTGVYAYYAVLVDATREIMGNPSAQSATVNPSGQRVTVDLTTITNETANSRVTHIDLYRNLNGGATYYFVARSTIATASYSDNNSDAAIQANDTLELDNNAPTAETYGVTKAAKGYAFSIGGHDGIGATAYRDDFTWAKLNRVDNQPTVNRTKIEPGLYGALMTMEMCGDRCVFYKERCIYELMFDLDPSGTTGDGFGKTVNTAHGAVNDRCVVNYGGKHFVLDENCIYINAGGTDVTEIHKPLRHYWERINWARKRWFSATYDDQGVYFFVALDGDTECQWCFVFDLGAFASQQPPRWYVYKYAFGVRDAIPFRFGATGPSNSALLFGMAWKRVAMIMTDQGYTGYLNAGYRDLVDPRLTATGTTASGGSTTTFVGQGADSFTYTNDAGYTVDVVGAYVTFINPDADKADSTSWAGTYRITGVSGQTITFTPAAPSTPPAGTTYVIGGLPDGSKLYTPVMAFDSPMRGKRAARLGIEFQPGGIEYALGLQVSTDRCAAQLSDITDENAQYTSTQYLPGVQMKMGGALADGGRIGVHAQPASGKGFRTLQIILDASNKVDCPAIVDAILVDDVREEVKEVP